MRLVVGYLATPSGADGLALGVQLARSLGAELDICMVLPPDRPVPSRVPAEPGYEDVLAGTGEAWLAQAAATVPDDVRAHTHLSFHDSFAQGLLDEVARLGARAVVLGAAGDGLLGRHSIGTVSSELLHSAPVPLALAPRGFRHSAAPHVREVTCALGTRTGADVLLRTAVRACERMRTPLRLVSLVALDPQGLGRDARKSHELALESARAHARTLLDTARAELPGDYPVRSLVADGDTVESAVAKLEWHDGDVVMVGSSRLAQPHRLFLGSTAVKMLRVVPVPMIVVPKHEFENSE
ncbi:universal stress protein [Rhodococcus rhodochrous]|uniref:Universal stress protein UspA n=1 Tax=Rhodococcus rhodochrous KG-21 TaxID=1441923 RepID=A0A0M8PJ87_RHORH|nr:universal stress protein [Rhodococcus rhodochrous]KOS57684.1 universal stress protein UspA [Rhodococcus rhodochrous KG-21]